jgi:hypothetical protein
MIYINKFQNLNKINSCESYVCQYIPFAFASVFFNFSILVHMVMKDHLEDGNRLAIDHNVEHGVPQQIRQHIQQVHLAQDHVDHHG